MNKKNPKEEEEEIFVFDNEERDTKFNTRLIFLKYLTFL
jgi:hypothetical protein